MFFPDLKYFANVFGILKDFSNSLQSNIYLMFFFIFLFCFHRCPEHFPRHCPESIGACNPNLKRQKIFVRYSYTSPVLYLT